MERLVLTDSERRDMCNLLDALERRYPRADSDDFLNAAPVITHELPKRIRVALNDFRLGLLSGTLTISGYPVDQDRIGPTPGHWRERQAEPPTLREELLLVLYASLVGDPFGWVTQQDGHLIHDVLPIRGHEHEQLGSSSEELLTWHTEDAFHPLRSDFLLFGCLRNPYAAATTIGSVDDLDLAESLRDVLFDVRFFILPDESHRPHNNSTDGGVDFSSVEQMRSRPDPIAVLFGDRDQPYLRADPYFMQVQDGDDEAQEALDHLVKVMDEQMWDMDLESGDYFFIDNLRVVHGRKPFTARHDGTDRWLKRINVTCDLRKSRAARASLTARAIR
jgi:Fe(II)/alpha-ketoglutarate-dependent arginine beta-hydroxylase